MAKSLKGKGGSALTIPMMVYTPPEVKRLAGLAADKADIPLSEWVVRAMCDALRRPELAVIPRKKPGAPRRDSDTNGSANGAKR
jgi:hypothetical protein